jgi:hypothetical protein
MKSDLETEAQPFWFIPISVEKNDTFIKLKCSARLRIISVPLDFIITFYSKTILIYNNNRSIGQFAVQSTFEFHDQWFIAADWNFGVELPA